MPGGLQFDILLPHARSAVRDLLLDSREAPPIHESRSSAVQLRLLWDVEPGFSSAAHRLDRPRLLGRPRAGGVAIPQTAPSGPQPLHAVRTARIFQIL